MQAPPEDIAKYKDTYNEGWRAIQNHRLAAMIKLGIVSHEQLAQVEMDRGKAKPWDQLSADEKKLFVRQADVFGCRAVSCGDAACAGHGEGTALAPRGGALCPSCRVPGSASPNSAAA